MHVTSPDGDPPIGGCCHDSVDDDLMSLRCINTSSIEKILGSVGLMHNEGIVAVVSYRTR